MQIHYQQSPASLFVGLARQPRRITSQQVADAMRNYQQSTPLNRDYYRRRWIEIATEFEQQEEADEQLSD